LRRSKDRTNNRQTEQSSTKRSRQKTRDRQISDLMQVVVTVVDSGFRARARV
jgi:hypothetical protein